MARFIDESPEYQPEDGEALANLEDEETQIPEEEQPAEPEEIQEAQDQDDIPEKYQGKDIKDIVRMHQEAEKLLGKQSSEVGELRKLVDDFVKTQLEANSPQQKEDEEDIDFFDDPQKAVERAIARHPKIKEAEEVTRAMKQQEILNKLQRSHPDFQEVISDANFGEWVAASKVRTELYQRADQQFDFDSADELLSLWKERQNIVKETAEMQDADRKRQLKAASTGTAKGSGEKPSRKIYRRADIIKLMQTDPNRYMDMAEEIRNAYAEGRVK
jgi:hypothetical protein